MEICLSVRHDDRGISDWIFHVTCGWLHDDCATNLTQISDVLKYIDITTYSLHPGVILTNISHSNGAFTKFFIGALMKISGNEKTADQGATNVLYLMLFSENKET